MKLREAEAGGARRRRHLDLIRGAEDLLQVLGDARLLVDAAVHLEREDDRVGRSLEADVLDRHEHRAQRDLGRQRVAVVNLRLALRAVEAVELDAPAAHE